LEENCTKRLELSAKRTKGAPESKKKKKKHSFNSRQAQLAVCSLLLSLARSFSPISSISPILPIRKELASRARIILFSSSLSFSSSLLSLDFSFFFLSTGPILAELLMIVLIMEANPD